MCVLQVEIVEAEGSAVAKHRLGINVPAVTNTDSTMQKLLESMFYMSSVSHELLNM
jgi:hypothetical protein